MSTLFVLKNIGTTSPSLSNGGIILRILSLRSLYFIRILTRILFYLCFLLFRFLEFSYLVLFDACDLKILGFFILTYFILAGKLGQLKDHKKLFN